MELTENTKPKTGEAARRESSAERTVPGRSEAARLGREAEALRKNLAKRKVQQRARKEQNPAED